MTDWAQPRHDCERTDAALTVFGLLWCGSIEILQRGERYGELPSSPIGRESREHVVTK